MVHQKIKPKLTWMATEPFQSLQNSLSTFRKSEILDMPKQDAKRKGLLFHQEKVLPVLTFLLKLKQVPVLQVNQKSKWNIQSKERKKNISNDSESEKVDEAEHKKDMKSKERDDSDSDSQPDVLF